MQFGGILGGVANPRTTSMCSSLKGLPEKIGLQIGSIEPLVSLTDFGASSLRDRSSATSDMLGLADV